MEKGSKRTNIARGAVGLSFLCGLIGLSAAVTDHTWKLGPEGWLLGGLLLATMGLFVLVDGLFAFVKYRVVVVPKH